MCGVDVLFQNFNAYSGAAQTYTHAMALSDFPKGLSRLSANGSSLQPGLTFSKGLVEGRGVVESGQLRTVHPLGTPPPSLVFFLLGSRACLPVQSQKKASRICLPRVTCTTTMEICQVPSFAAQLHASSQASVRGARALPFDVTLTTPPFLGCLGTDECGVQFDVRLPQPVVSATVSYWFRFSEAYDWTSGGKLPGMCSERTTLSKMETSSL